MNTPQIILQILSQEPGSGITPPPPEGWILATGEWNDSGEWDDTASWED